eukprot:augustus_masked-scaffold_10-processed-gene-5.53-mRNA-1 protein AED:1.00 eAED:1.00 QI:0/0/0/0/1/1/4/0/391
MTVGGVKAYGNFCTNLETMRNGRNVVLPNVFHTPVAMQGYVEAHARHENGKVNTFNCLRAFLLDLDDLNWFLIGFLELSVLHATPTIGKKFLEKDNQDVLKAIDKKIQEINDLEKEKCTLLKEVLLKHSKAFVLKSSPARMSKMGPIICFLNDEKAEIISQPREWRMVVDMKLLNSHTRKTPLIMPNLEQQVSFTKGDTVFGSFDILSGFDYLPMAEDSRKYFTIVAYFGCYEMCGSPQGWVVKSQKEAGIIDNTLTSENDLEYEKDNLIIPTSLVLRLVLHNHLANNQASIKEEKRTLLSFKLILPKRTKVVDIIKKVGNYCMHCEAKAKVIRRSLNTSPLSKIPQEIIHADFLYINKFTHYLVLTDNAKRKVYLKHCTSDMSEVVATAV